MSANTQDFRVKHGLQVANAATFSNTVTVAGNVSVHGASLTLNTGASSLAANIVGKVNISNTVTIANGGMVISNGGLQVTSTSAGILVDGGGLTVTGSLTVTGNNIIQGTLETETDNITLISGLSPSSSPSTNAQFAVNRGNQSNVSILWDEVANKWKFTNDGTYYYPFRTYSDLVYNFDTSTTTNADPGNGRIRFNSTTYNLVTEIVLDNLEYGGTDVSTYLASFDDPSATIPGVFTVRSSSDPDKFVVYRITALTTATSGCVRFTVEYVAGGATTFSAFDIVFVQYARTGDKGDKGQKGEIGDKGQKGEKGEKGAQGDKGIQGDKGDVGPQGDKGEKGQKGELGPTGNTGNTGPGGAKGDTGGMFYYFDTGITESSSVPAVQSFILNSSTPSTVTSIYVRALDRDLVNNQIFFESFNNYGNSTNRGYLSLRNVANTAQTLLYTITGVTSAGQTQNKRLTVTNVSTGYNSVFPFGTTVMMDYSFIGQKGEKGDKGDKGDKIVSAAYYDANNTTIFTNGDTSTFVINGVKGNKGERVSSASYTDANNTVVFTNSDTSTFAVTGVKGQKGEKGDKGDKGEKGNKGEGVLHVNTASNTASANILLHDDSLVLDSQVKIVGAGLTTVSSNGAAIIINTSDPTTFTSNTSFTSLIDIEAISESVTTLTGATGTVTHDISLGSVFYHSSIVSNFTANFTNVPTTNGKSITVAVLLSQGATGYYPNVCQINGSAVTIRWIGNVTPTPSSSKVELVVFNFIRVASSWTVLGQLTPFA